MTEQQQQQIKTPRQDCRISLDDFLADAEITACKAEREKANGNGSEPPRFCCCRELIDSHGKRLPYSKWHDCEYTARRSFLVDDAARIATQKIGDPVGDSSRGYRWTKCFVAEMEKLSAPLLRQSDNGTREQKAA